MTADAGGRTPPAAPPGPLACPSASPDADGALLFGIVLGTAEAPETMFIGPRPPDPDILALAAPATPAEVFRFTARCQEKGCGYFASGRCGVAAAVVAHLPEVADGVVDAQREDREDDQERRDGGVAGDRPPARRRVGRVPGPHAHATPACRGTSPSSGR
jgi:hypothetical protein